MIANIDPHDSKPNTHLQNGPTERETPVTLATIEQKCTVLREDFDAIVRLLVERDEAVAAAAAKFQARLDALIAAFGDDHEHLEQLLRAAPQLFIKPRTQVFADIKVGFRKGSGGLVIADEKRTIELIEKFLQPHAEVLIHTEKTVVKKALNELDVKDLKQIGVTVESTTDIPVIKIEESDYAARVNALRKTAQAKV